MHWIVNLDKKGPKRVNQAAVLCGNTIYSFGGYSLEVSIVHLRMPIPIDVHALNTITFKWTKRPIPEVGIEQANLTPYYRYGHTCVYYEDNKLIYLFGGRADWTRNLCNTLFAYDPKTHLWSKVITKGKIPNGRDGHSATIVANSMYIFGGYVQEEQKFSNDMNEYNFNTCTWTKIIIKLFKPHWRDFHTATAIKDKIYVFGGRMDSGGETYTGTSFYCNKLFEFDTINHVWKEVIPEEVEDDKTRYVPKGRRSHSAVAYKNKIIFFGGFDENLLEHYNDLFEFNIDTLKWTKIEANGAYPSKRRRHCCFVFKNRMFLFGGTGPGKAFKIQTSSLLYQDIQNIMLQVLSNNRQRLNEINNNNNSNSLNNQNVNNLIVNNNNNNNNNNGNGNFFDDDDYDIDDDDDIDGDDDDDDDDDEDGSFVSDNSSLIDNDDIIEDQDLNLEDKKLHTKCDLHILNLEVSSLHDLAILSILKYKIDYKNSYLPNTLKEEIINYSQ